MLWVELWLRAARDPALRPVAAQLYERYRDWVAEAIRPESRAASSRPPTPIPSLSGRWRSPTASGFERSSAIRRLTRARPARDRGAARRARPRAQRPRLSRRSGGEPAGPVHDPAADQRHFDVRLRDLLQRHAHQIAVEHRQVGGQALDDPPARSLLMELEGAVSRVSRSTRAASAPRGRTAARGRPRRPRPRSG